MTPKPNKKSRNAMDGLPPAAAQYCADFDPDSAAYMLASACLAHTPDALESCLRGNGIWPNVRGATGLTPLAAVIRYRTDGYAPAIVARLLAHPLTDVNACDDNGNTPLHFAAVNADRDMIAVLQRAQADAGIVNKTGQTPLDIARDTGCADAFLPSRRRDRRRDAVVEADHILPASTPDATSDDTPEAVAEMPAAQTLDALKPQADGCVLDDDARFALLSLLHEKQKFGRTTLTDLLADTLAQGDFPKTVHYLMLAGADAMKPAVVPMVWTDALFPDRQTVVYDIAIRLRRCDSLREIALWSPDWTADHTRSFCSKIGHALDVARYWKIKQAINKMPHDPDADAKLDDLRERFNRAAKIATLRKIFRKQDKASLCRDFSANAKKGQDFDSVMAQFAELQTPRKAIWVFGGGVDIPRSALVNALNMAFRHNDYLCIDALARQGVPDDFPALYGLRQDKWTDVPPDWRAINITPHGAMAPQGWYSPRAKKPNWTISYR